jgi:hypothetical protein
MSATNIIENWVPDDMLEVYLNEPDDFLKIRETLSRIGVASKHGERILYQSCHILHKQGRYFIVHFKELFCLDGKQNTITANDLARRNTIAILLSDWNLLRLSRSDFSQDQCVSLKDIKIISHSQKSEWTLAAKYTVGNTKRNKN